MNVPKVDHVAYQLQPPQAQPQPKQSAEEAQETPGQKRAEKLKSLGITQHGQPQPKQSAEEARETPAEKGAETQKGGNSGPKGLDKYV